MLAKFKRMQTSTKCYVGIVGICICLYAIQVFISGMSTTNTIETIPILGFHNIIKDNEKEEYFTYDMWVDSESAFKEKMAYLYERGYHTISLDELYAWKQGEQEIDDKAFVLTFDDGYLASSTLVPQILRQYNFNATTFVLGGNISKDEQIWDGSQLQYASQANMQNQTNMNYASHTYALHNKIDGKFKVDALDIPALQEDFDKEKEVVDCTYVAYPFGKYSDKMIDVLQKNNVRMAFGYHENKKAKRKGDFYTIPRFAITSYTTLDSFQAMLESK